MTCEPTIIRTNLCNCEFSVCVDVSSWSQNNSITPAAIVFHFQLPEFFCKLTNFSSLEYLRLKNT